MKLKHEHYEKTPQYRKLKKEYKKGCRQHKKVKRGHSVSSLTYRNNSRVRHFKEWIKQGSDRIEPDIPTEIYTKLKLEISNYNYNLGYNKLTRGRVGIYLINIGEFEKYGSFVPFILNKLIGQPQPIMTIKIENMITEMFIEVQEQFRIWYHNKQHVSMSSYCYIVHKIVQLLELNHMLCLFPLIHCQQKLAKQDEFWKRICKDLKWPFITSVNT